MGAQRATWLVADGGLESQLAPQASYDGPAAATPVPATGPAVPRSDLAAAHGVIVSVIAGALLWGGLFAIVRWLIA